MILLSPGNHLLQFCLSIILDHKFHKSGVTIKENRPVKICSVMKVNLFFFKGKMISDNKFLQNLGFYILLTKKVAFPPPH